MPVNAEKFKKRLLDGGFRAVRPIGKGNYATVWECQTVDKPGAPPGQHTPPRAVAAKIIDLSYLRMHKNSRVEIERIKREVTILKDLKHPNIVRLEKTLMVGTEALILVMEYVPGKELFNLIMDKLDAQTNFAESEAAVIFHQLLRAVAYLHSRRIIHRDIKPENIMVRDDWRQRPHDGVKLIDFGLSKQMNQSMAKTFVGTPEYYAPEVNPRDRSGATYTQGADCWSCGISLYVMLVGQFPGKVASDGVSVYFDPDIMRHLSPSAVTLLKQMLATDPAVRINVQQALSSDWLREALPCPPAICDSLSASSGGGGTAAGDTVMLPLHGPASTSAAAAAAAADATAAQAAAAQATAAAAAAAAAQPQIRSFESTNSVVDLDLTKGGSGDHGDRGGGGSGGRGGGGDDVLTPGGSGISQDLGTASASQSALVTVGGAEKRNKLDNVDDDDDVPTVGVNGGGGAGGGGGGGGGGVGQHKASPRVSNGAATGAPGSSSPTASAYEQRMKQLLLAHRDLAFAAAKACETSRSSIVVQNKCRVAAQTCREELFQAQRVLGNLGQVAKSVLQRQPDLQLGVMEKSTEMCQAFFQDFDKWVGEIKLKAARMVVSTQKTARGVQDVVSTSETVKAMRSVASTAFTQSTRGRGAGPLPMLQLTDAVAESPGQAAASPTAAAPAPAPAAPAPAPARAATTSASLSSSSSSASSSLVSPTSASPASRSPQKVAKVGSGVVEVQDVTSSFFGPGSSGGGGLPGISSASGSDVSQEANTAVSRASAGVPPQLPVAAGPGGGAGGAVGGGGALDASQFLRESLASMGESLAGSGGAAALGQNPQLLQLIDLIFPLVFAQQQQQQQQQQQSSAGGGGGGGGGASSSAATHPHHTAGDRLVVPNMVQDAQLNQWLFKCDDTLQDIANFWANLENILEHLRHRTGHVEPLIAAAAKSANIEKLLLQRMRQYFSMWKQILRMCEGMVVEAMQMREDLYGFLRGGTSVTAAAAQQQRITQVAAAR